MLNTLAQWLLIIGGLLVISAISTSIRRNIRRRKIQHDLGLSDDLSDHPSNQRLRAEINEMIDDQDAIKQKEKEDAIKEAFAKYKAKREELRKEAIRLTGHVPGWLQSDEWPFK